MNAASRKSSVLKILQKLLFVCMCIYAYMNVCVGAIAMTTTGTSTNKSDCVELDMHYPLKSAAYGYKYVEYV